MNQQSSPKLLFGRGAVVKVLLVNSNRETMPWPVVPIGLSLVATATEAAGHQVAVVDLTLHRNPVALLRRELARQKPDVVGVSVRNIDNCNFESPRFYLNELREQVMAVVRKGAPEALLVVGGSAVNIAPRLVAEYLGADCALAGEGEVALPQLLSALMGHANALPAGFRAITAHGMLRRRPKPECDRASAQSAAKGAFTRAPAFLAQSLAYRWTSWEAYARYGSSYPLQTKRGCARRCTYCVYNKLEGLGYRLRSPSDVANEMEAAIQHGVDRFEFVDSTFNVPKRHALAVCRELSKRSLGAKLSTMGLNPSNVDTELVDAMRAAGFDNVMCSAESASDAILKSMAKGYTRSHVARTASALQSGGLPTYWFFLLGAPGENAATVKETLDFCAASIPKTHVALFATGLRILPGTPLAERCRQSGWLAPHETLLKPTWYVSPELDLDALGETLAARSAAHSNWMLNGETTLAPRAALAMKSGFRILGWDGPFWQHLPRVFGLAARVGSRERGVQSAWRRVLAVRDIVHHR